MQLDQGRIDVKTFTYDTHQPYEILTPRGTITLQQQGDYYVEAGSTQDPTRLGVRSGAAQIQAPNGQVLAVRAGPMEVAVVGGIHGEGEDAEEAGRDGVHGDSSQGSLRKGVFPGGP